MMMMVMVTMMTMTMKLMRSPTKTGLTTQRIYGEGRRWGEGRTRSGGGCGSWDSAPRIPHWAAGVSPAPAPASGTCHTV